MNSVQTSTLSLSHSTPAVTSHYCPGKYASNNHSSNAHTANIAQTDKLSLNQQVGVSYQVSLGQSSYQQESFTYQRYSASQSVSVSRSQDIQTLSTNTNGVERAFDGAFESTFKSNFENRPGRNSNNSVAESSAAVPVNKNQSVDVDSTTISSGASNILKYINAYISSAVESGASEEELDKIIGQGLAGFKQGYGEAEQILSDLGQLDEVVTPSINKLYDEVVSGIEQLRERYIPQTVSKGEPVEGDNLSSNSKNEDVLNKAEPTSITPSPLASKIFSQPQLVDIENSNRISSNQTPNAYYESSTEKSTYHSSSSVFDLPLNKSATGTYHQSYERSEKFSFSLTTQEGDKVTISADSFFQQDSGVLAGNTLGVNFGSISLADNTFFSIEGDINEDEALAINELLEQVVALADEFYYGDIEKAFNQALDIGYDSSEIAAYMLDLQLTETQAVATTYTDNQASQVNPLIDLPSELALMDRFVKDITNLAADKNATIVKQLFDINDFLNTIADNIDKNLIQAQAGKSSIAFSEIFSRTVDRL